ncbi:5'/3'-nucleotidase SurE [Thermoactinospora rubra]|uniref:5'/3'-nucleotidase SurE n=1 Tax=Thermoactinospora rubra TaxID=1088767 RepID=UPI000A1214F5|nr:5'/3'-nucleotidase SurE [Thermoactinospora rubra]
MVRRAAIALLLVLTAFLTGSSPAQAHPRQGLRILLTNDDGYAFPFIQALRQALSAAGHQVTIVAPAADASGSGTAVNARFGATVEAVERSPGVWSVTGSPGDAVAFGLGVVFAGDPPDLVVSGPNAGQNVAAVVNHSGTVGAAIAALDAGVPAVAFSTAVDTTTTPPSFPSAQRSIAFAVRLVARLGDPRRVLPPRTVLNVNYPVRPGGTVSFARLGTLAFVSTRYAPAPEVCAACYRVLPVLATEPDPVRDADRTLLDAGHVTITPLDGSWEASPMVTALLRARLAGLTP